MNSPSKEEINYALSPMASDPIAIHILSRAYKEAIEAIIKVRDSFSYDDRPDECEIMDDVIDKCPKEEQA